MIVRALLLAIALMVATATLASAESEFPACTAGRVGVGSWKVTNTGGDPDISFQNIVLQGTNPGGSTCSWSNLIVSGQIKSTYATCGNDYLRSIVNNDQTGYFSDYQYSYGNGIGEHYLANSTQWELALLIAAGGVGNCNTQPVQAAASFEMMLPMYTDSYKDRQVLLRLADGYDLGNWAGVVTQTATGTWHSTTTVPSAPVRYVNRIDLYLKLGNFAQGSQVNLYVE